MAALALDEEEELIARAQHDPEAFGDLFLRHHSQIYRFAFTRLRDHQAAEDVASEVFLKAFAALPRFRPSGRPILAWLYRIAANAVVDRRRRQNAAEPFVLEMPASVDTPETIAVHSAEVREVWMLIDALPRAQRTALVLKFGRDWSNREIASSMGKTPGATKVLVHRALTQVRARACTATT